MSIFDQPDGVQAPPSWRCPECHTLQAETTQCWRCDKPAFTCKTCSFYRPSVVADLGYCAQDAARTPLSADETRACWEAAGVAGLGAAASAPPVPSTGLFSDADIAPPQPSPVIPDRPAVRRRPSSKQASRKARPPLEAPGRAAWVEPESDALVEAPTVEPGKQLSTEVQRRRRRWFG